MTLGSPTKQSKAYDNTRLSGYKTCPRSYFIRHVLGWTKEGVAIPLDFGSCWHEGMDAIWAYGKQYGAQDLAALASDAFNKRWKDSGREVNLSLAEADAISPRTPMIAHEMFAGYVESRWNMLQEADLISGEQPFAVPLPGMEDTWYIGRLDKVVQYASQTLVLEHKSTTAYAVQGNFRSDYVSSWWASSQVKGYQFGAGLYYPSTNAVWVDAALVHKKIHNAFKFIPVAHSFPLLAEWINDTKEWAIRVSNEIERYERVGELEPGMFPKNEESCYAKFGECPFLDICRACADPSKLPEVPNGYVKQFWEPFSILHLDKLVKDSNEGSGQI